MALLYTTLVHMAPHPWKSADLSVVISMMNLLTTYFSSVQLLTCVRRFMTPWTAACQASLSITKLMSVESVMPSNHLIVCRPLLLLPSIFPSIRVFVSESVLRIRWSKHWNFSFRISPSNEYLGLTSFRIDWFNLAIQGTLKSLLQSLHNSKASILWFCFSFLFFCHK